MAPADVFEALADPVRRAVLGRLAAGPSRVVDLAAEHPISRPAMSRHLRVLGEAGLVEVEDRGRERHYRLQPSGLTPVNELLDALQPARPPWTSDPAPSADPAVQPDPTVQPDPPFRSDPPFGADVLDGLTLEVRRTVRDRRPRATRPAPSTETRPGHESSTGTEESA